MNRDAIALIRAWVRYDDAVDAYNKELRSRFQVSGLQLAILRIASERAPLRMRELRGMLSMHPATLGQAVDGLVRKGFLESGTDPADARGKVIAVTAGGKELMAAAPLAGPVRLRYVKEEPEKLQRLAAALDELVELFGLTEWNRQGEAQPPNRKGED